MSATRQKWTDEEKQRFALLYKKGFSHRQIAKFMGRREGSIMAQVRAQNLSRSKTHSGVVPADRRFDDMYRANVEPEWENVDVI